jgi:hypothetical protein
VLHNPDFGGFMPIPRRLRIFAFTDVPKLISFLCLVLLAAATAGGQSAELTAAISASTKMGELNGNTYYYKSAGMGVGQIFKVPSANPTSVTMVGMIVGDKYMIQPAEKSDFFAVVTDKPASAFSGGAPTSGQPMSASASNRPTDPAGCGTGVGSYYLSDSGWAPMTFANAQRGSGVSIAGTFSDAVKNPFNSRGGETKILSFANPAAHVKVGPSPKFCMVIAASTSTDNIVIGNVDVKGDHREMESLRTAKTSAVKWIPAERAHKVNVIRVSDSVVQITPQQPLPPGQYLLAGPAGMYDFGVQ